MSVGDFDGVSDWSKIKYFNKSEFKPAGEFQGDFEMSRALIFALDNMRHELDQDYPYHKFKCLVNVGYATEGHSPNSLHYSGRAVDGVLVQADEYGEYYPVSVVDQAMLLYRYLGSAISIGVYPHWTRVLDGGKIRTGGFHVDTRYEIGKNQIFWYRDQDGHYHYYNRGLFGKWISDLVLYMQAFK